MIQKLFNKYMTRYFTWLEWNIKAILDNQKLISKRLSEIDEVLTKKQKNNKKAKEDYEFDDSDDSDSVVYMEKSWFH